MELGARPPDYVPWPSPKGWVGRDANVPRTQLRMARDDELRAPISSLVDDTRIAAPAMR